MFVSPRAPPRVPPPAAGALNTFEFRLNTDIIKKIQAALCTAPNGKIKSLQDAVVAFYRGSGSREDLAQADRVQSKGLSARDIEALQEILIDNEDCKLRLDGPADVGRRLR
jgi:hypothetical protein